MADVPHLLKNLRTSFLKHNVVLPDETVAKYALPTPEVRSSFVFAVVAYQEGKELKLAPKLTAKHVQPSQYQKMRVNMAAQVLSHATASAIRTLVERRILPNPATTTAFFCEFFNRWFDIMNCRCFSNALFPNSQQKVAQLNEVLEVVQGLKFPNGARKPVQSGIKLSVHSLLSLHQDLVINGSLNFVMSGRLTQDALENIFSQVRSFGNSHPKPTQFRNALKLMIVGQFMEVPSSCSYDEDDTPHLLSFIKEYDHQPSTHTDDDVITPLDALIGAASSSLDVCEENGLYYVVGWALFKELQSSADCADCKSAFTTANTLELSRHPEAVLTLLKSYNSSNNLTSDNITQHLCHPSPQAFVFFKRAEAIFRANVECLQRSPNLESEIINRIPSNDFRFPDCHHILMKSLRRFIKLRLHVHAKKVSNAFTAKQYASKSAARANIK